MQNLALTGSVVLGNRQIYQLFDQFERAFWQNFSRILRNHIGTRNCACGTKDTFLQLCGEGRSRNFFWFKKSFTFQTVLSIVEG